MAEKRLKAFDGDGDDRVDLAEFKMALGEGVAVAEAEARFRRYDGNGDGTISKEEMEAAMKQEDEEAGRYRPVRARKGRRLSVNLDQVRTDKEKQAELEVINLMSADNPEPSRVAGGRQASEAFIRARKKVPSSAPTHTHSPSTRLIPPRFDSLSHASSVRSPPSFPPMLCPHS